MIPERAGPVSREPSPWETRRLWSLRDMMTLVVGSFYFLLRSLRTHIEFDDQLEKQKGLFADYEKEHERLTDDAKQTLERLKKHCSELGLIESDRCIDRVLRKITNYDTARPRLCYELQSLLDLIESEGGDRLAFTVKRPKGDLYEDLEIKWRPIIKKFPSYEKDIEEGIDSYLLDLDTGCVFYFMRVAEIGLRALARERRVKLPRKQILEWADWQTIITALRNRVEKLATNNRRGPARDAALEFYRGALGEFEAFKDEFRNNVMHTRKRYDELDSLRVLTHVGNFMEKLSRKVDETGKAQIKWGRGIKQ